jgi:hypothetical protein
MQPQALASGGGQITLVAIASASKKRFNVFAPFHELQAQALAMREVLMTHALTTLEKPYPLARWTTADGHDADCIDTQLIVTINEVQFAGFPAGGLAGRVLTELYPASHLETGVTPERLAPPCSWTPILRRVASGTSTFADARQLAQLINHPLAKEAIP